MSEHARLSCSNHRWPHCPGSIREEARYPDTSSEASIDGTGSHLLLEMALINGVRAEAYLDQVIGEGHADKPMGWLVDSARAERVQMCLDYVYRRYRELSAEYPECDVSIFAEQRVNPGRSHSDPAMRRDDWWGTADVTLKVTERDALKALRFVEVVDLKDGRGWVKEKNNTQLLSYGIGAVFGGRARKVPVKARVTIVQPKTNPPVRYVDTDSLELERELRWLVKAAFATDDPNAPLVPGDHCQWCKANMKRGGHCDAAAQKSIEEIQMTTGTIATDSTLSGLLSVDVSTAPAETLAAIMDQEAQLQAAFDRVRKEIESRVEQGLPVPGWSLEPGRASRVWADEEAAIAKLKTCRLKIDEYSPRALISPAQAEKMVGPERFKKHLAGQIVEKAGPLKVKRVALGSEKDAATMFKDVGGEAPGVKASLFADETPALPESTTTETPAISFI